MTDQRYRQCQREEQKRCHVVDGDQHFSGIQSWPFRIQFVRHMNQYRRRGRDSNCAAQQGDQGRPAEPPQKHANDQRGQEALGDTGHDKSWCSPRLHRMKRGPKLEQNQAKCYIDQHLGLCKCSLVQ
nr:hypothetical protein [Ottowia sp. GY511]